MFLDKQKQGTQNNKIQRRVIIMATTSNTKGAITSATNGQMQKKKDPQNLKDYVYLYKDSIARALPSVLTVERFSRMVTTALTKTPKLAECTTASFIGAMLTAAQLGLEPNTPLGQAYLIPYYNGRTKQEECQFQMGYKGMIDLCYRSGEFKIISAHIVYENDEFEFEYGIEDRLRHKPTMGEKGRPMWVYAIYKLQNGGYSFEVMGYDECLAFGKAKSKTFSNGPWQTDPEEMAKKTVIKRLLKYAPIRSEFIRNAEISDGTTPVFNQSVKDDVPPIEYINVEVESQNGQSENVEVDTSTGEVVQNE